MQLIDRAFDEHKELERLRRCIANPPENSRVFVFTPSIAETVLKEYNTMNRPKKPGKIKLYSEYMQARRWALDGNTVKFTKGGRLADGQNRLMACVRSGVSFSTHVVFGIADELFNTLDQGKNRTGADALAVAGFTNCTVLAGAVRWVHLIETDRVKQRDSYPQDQILRLIQERYVTLPDIASQATFYANTAQPPSLIVAMIYLLTKANAAKAAEFLTAWRAGQWGGRFKPIGLMQARIADISSKSSGRVHEAVRGALIIKAWNLFIEGHRGTRSAMEWSVADDVPKIVTVNG